MEEPEFYSNSAYNSELNQVSEKGNGNKRIHCAKMEWAFKFSNRLMHGKFYSKIREKQREVTAWEKHFFFLGGHGPWSSFLPQPIESKKKKKKKIKMGVNLTRGGG